MEKENDEDNPIKSNNSTDVDPSSPRNLKRKTPEEEEEKDELPLDVLNVIAKKLDVDSLFEFAAVCKSWGIFHKSYWRNFMASEEPFLIQTSSKMNAYSLFSTSEQKVELDYSYINDFRYAGYSSGYMIMVDAADHRLKLINPFTRRMKKISTLAIRGNIPIIGCVLFLAFVKGSNEFVVVGMGCRYKSLHIYHSRNSRWVTCWQKEEENPCMVVSCSVFHNSIYVITNKAKIGVLSLNSSNLKFFSLKNTPVVNSYLLKLVSYDNQLLVVDCDPPQRLNVYKIDFSSMGFVKMETLGEFALFYGWTRCYALSNLSKGYDSNVVYYVDSSCNGCRAYSMDKTLLKCIAPADGLPSPAWVDWCFLYQRDEVDYSMVE